MATNERMLDKNYNKDIQLAFETRVTELIEIIENVIPNETSIIFVVGTLSRMLATILLSMQKMQKESRSTLTVSIADLSDSLCDFYIALEKVNKENKESNKPTIN